MSAAAAAEQSLMSHITTSYPRVRNSDAYAYPTPLAEPVMTTPPSGMAWILLEEDDDDVVAVASRRSGREEKCRKEEVDGGGCCSLGDANALVEREDDARTTRRRRHVTADHIIIVDEVLGKFKVCVELSSLSLWVREERSHSFYLLPPKKVSCRPPRRIYSQRCKMHLHRVERRDRVNRASHKSKQQQPQHLQHLQRNAILV